MVAGKNHIIQKQLLEVEMENPPDAFQFRNRLGEVFYEKLLPRLESIFNDINYPDKFIRIGSLPIDVGVIPVENWEEELINRSADKIKEALLLQDPLWVAEAVDVEFSKNKSYPPQDQVNERRTEFSGLTIEEFSEVLYFFLKHGRLPWFVSSRPDFKLTVLLEDLLENKSFFSTSFTSFLQEANDDQVLRFIYQLEEKALDKVISLLLTAENTLFWKDVIDKRSRLKDYLSKFSLSIPVIKKLLFLPLFKSFPSQPQSPVNLYFVQLFADAVSIHISKRADTILKEMRSLLIPLHSGSSSDNFSSVSASSLLGAIEKLKNHIFDKAWEKKKTDEVRNEKKHEEPLEELYIANAGLVLLHPFLPSYFKNIQLLDEKNLFIDEEARMKAVLITQFLITGETEFEEHQLVLNKILCGVNVEDVVYTVLELSSTEVDEANDLLTQVVEMWKMNGAKVNGSIEGLREAFLQRPGKLIKRNKDWRLQVEQKPYDMVMNALPWGIGMIRNTWMNGMLWVDWA